MNTPLNLHKLILMRREAERRLADADTLDEADMNAEANMLAEAIAEADTLADADALEARLGRVSDSA